MPIARTTATTWRYVLRCDLELPTDQQTVFTLRALTAQQRLALHDLPHRDASGIINPQVGSMQRAVVRMGLVGWSNFRTADGAIVDPVVVRRDTEGGIEVRDAVAWSSLNALDVEHLIELAEAILAGNTLTGDDAKNSQ